MQFCHPTEYINVLFAPLAVHTLRSGISQLELGVWCIVGEPPCSTQRVLIATAMVSVPSPFGDKAKTPHHHQCFCDSNISLHLTSSIGGNLIGRVNICLSSTAADVGDEIDPTCVVREGVTLPTGIFICPFSLHQLHDCQAERRLSSEATGSRDRPQDGGVAVVEGMELFRDLYSKLFSDLQVAVHKTLLLAADEQVYKQNDEWYDEADWDCWRTGWIQPALLIESLRDARMVDELKFIESAISSDSSSRRSHHRRITDSLECPACIYFYPLLNLLAVRYCCLKLLAVLPRLSREVLRVSSGGGQTSWLCFQQAVLRSFGDNECPLTAVEWMWLHRWRPWSVNVMQRDGVYEPVVRSDKVIDYLTLLKDILRVKLIENYGNVGVIKDDDTAAQDTLPIRSHAPYTSSLESSPSPPTREDKESCANISPKFINVVVSHGKNIRLHKEEPPNAFITCSIIPSEDAQSSQSSRINSARGCAELCSSPVVFQQHCPVWNFCQRLSHSEGVKAFPTSPEDGLRNSTLRVSVWHCSEKRESNLLLSRPSFNPLPDGTCLIGECYVPLANLYLEGTPIERMCDIVRTCKSFPPLAQRKEVCGQLWVRVSKEDETLASLGQLMNAFASSIASAKAELAIADTTNVPVPSDYSASPVVPTASMAVAIPPAIVSEATTIGDDRLKMLDACLKMKKDPELLEVHRENMKRLEALRNRLIQGRLGTSTNGSVVELHAPRNAEPDVTTPQEDDEEHLPPSIELLVVPRIPPPLSDGRTSSHQQNTGSYVSVNDAACYDKTRSYPQADKKDDEKPGKRALYSTDEPEKEVLEKEEELDLSGGALHNFLKGCMN
eukprot:GHVQ01001746.1.p1 GENE.GHVQ01001746.1~~GHVQ01001746.1.p1  ORF type:complete len:839 (+),score=108.07 GHVQ01001746.1:1761-4277(+)